MRKGRQASQQPFSIIVQNPDDLAVAAYALASNGSAAWATLMTEKGPVWVPVADVLRILGMS